MRRSIALLLALAVAGCGGIPLPPTSMERLNNAAYDLATATRFGRMDMASDNVAAEAKAEFRRRHRAWGKKLRIVDVELDGIELVGDNNAEVDLTVSWHRLDETIIRSTSVAQHWQQKGSDWMLVDESTSSGAPGLFPGGKRKTAASKIAESVDLPDAR